MTARLIALLLVVPLLAGCGGDAGQADERPGIPTSCGLPPPEPKVNASIVPRLFVEAADGQVTRAERERGGFIAAINVPLSVTEAFNRYRTRVVESGYEIVGEDNEGFEAELYIQKSGQLGAIQVRMSACEEASIVFVNVIEQ